MNLYYLTSEYRALLSDASDEAESSGGVIPDNICDAIDKIEGLRDAKIENCVKVISQLKAEKTAIDAEIERLQKMADSRNNRVEFIRKWISANMLPGEKIKTPIVSVSCRETESVNIVAEVPSDDRYGTTKTIFSVSKTKIKQAIESGEKINFAEIVKTKSITIR